MIIHVRSVVHDRSTGEIFQNLRCPKKFQILNKFSLCKQTVQGKFNPISVLWSPWLQVEIGDFRVIPIWQRGAVYYSFECFIRFTGLLWSYFAVVMRIASRPKLALGPLDSWNTILNWIYFMKNYMQLTLLPAWIKYTVIIGSLAGIWN